MLRRDNNAVSAIHYRFMHFCILQYPLGTACDADVDPLNYQQVLAQHVRPFKFQVLDSSYDQLLRSDKCFSAGQAQPYEIVPCFFYTFSTNINNCIISYFNVLHRIGVLADTALSESFFHRRPPFPCLIGTSDCRLKSTDISVNMPQGPDFQEVFALCAFIAFKNKAYVKYCKDE